MIEITRAYKYRIYPNEDQQIKLNQTFGCVRFLWNALVANFNAYGTEDYVDKLDEIRIKKNNDFLYSVSATALQQKRIDFAETKKQFFNKKRKKLLGRMQFKKKFRCKDSYRLPAQKIKLNQDESTIRLCSVGWIPYIQDRKIPEMADVRSVTISRTKSGKYFISVLVREEIKQLPVTNKKVGIDLGLKEMCTLSNGDVVNNPRWFRETQAKLKKAQKHLSRKMKGSNRYEKQRKKVALVHEKIRNQRVDFLHNITTSLVHEFDVIAVEDLDISGMLKNKQLSKSISDVSWYEFARQLKYKCDWYGKTFVQIDRFYPSSQMCSSCGYRDEKKELSVREWTCPICNVTHDRDFNAAKNILFKGYSDLTGLSVEEASAELVDYRRGEDVRLNETIGSHLAASVKRLDELVCLS